MTHQEQWLNLLIDVVIAKHQHQINGDIGGLRIDRVNSILVSGLLIRVVSILDEALSFYIAENNIIISGGNKLYHRLLSLNDSSLLLDYDDIDQWRTRRNDVGHEISEIYTWEELSECLTSIYRELSNLNILTNYPPLTYTMQKRRLRDDETDVSIDIETTVKIHEENNIESTYYQFGWHSRSQN